MSDKREYYSLVIAWGWDDSEQGTYGWSGWASSPEEAELFARQEMYCENGGREPDDPEEGVHDDGPLIEMYVGASTTAAPQVAEIVEELIASDTLQGADREKVELMMELLRPGYKEEMAQEDSLSPAPSV
jgi:hypothetical protein